MSLTQPNKLTKVVKRFLDLTWFLFLFLSIVWPIAVIIVGLSISSDPDQRHADINVFSSFQINSDISTELEESDANKSSLILSGRGDLKIENTRSRLSWYLSGAISQVMLFIFLYGLRAMRKLFTSLAAGETFTGQNIESTRMVAYVVIAWHTVFPLLQYFGSRIMLHDIAFDVPGIQLYPAFQVDPGGIFIGLAILVLSGVLREAVNIHKEQALTI